MVRGVECLLHHVEHHSVHQEAHHGAPAPAGADMTRDLVKLLSPANSCAGPGSMVLGQIMLGNIMLWDSPHLGIKIVLISLKSHHIAAKAHDLVPEA